MKKNLSTFIAIIACVLLALNTIKISTLQKEVDRLHSDLDNEIFNVNQNIDGIYGDVQLMLEEEANQLAVSEWKYGDINIDAGTAEIFCTIVPKAYTPGTTQAAIVCNGQEYPLNYTNEQFTATIELPLFDRNELTAVKLNDNGTIRTQELEWIIEPRYEALILSYAGMGGSSTGKPGNGEYVWSPEYGVTINIQHKGEFQIQSVELVEVLDGEEICRTPIDLSAEGQKAYQEALRKTKNPAPEFTSGVIDVSGPTYEGDVHFIYYLDKDYHIPNGSMLEFYVDVVDGNGLRYRSFAESIAVTADGEPDDLRAEEMRMYAFAEVILIFDEAGNVIFEIDPELFK